jgi:glycosyltransferase involved in cell wall biosynthesis
MHVVGVSVLAAACGNAVTAHRIASHLVRLGATCELVDVDAPTLPPADAYWGIHAFRAGRLLQSAARPFVLVLGGTDVNTFVDDPQRNAFMETVLRRAFAVVAFSDELAAAARSSWPFLADKLTVIAPAADCPGDVEPGSRSDDDVWSHLLLGTVALGARSYFVLPTALRPVKDPLFVVDEFERWHRTDPERAPLLLLFGPERGDDAFAARVRERVSRCSGVYFVGVVPRDALLALERSRRCLAVLNTSESEGLANAMIEAALLGVPRVARNIAGNRSVVEHGVTGFLFDTPQQCVEQLRLVASGYDCAPMTARASALIAERFSAQAEASSYFCALTRAAERGDESRRTAE